MTYRPKDFIRVSDTLLFAVVSDQIEDERVLCTLRYAKLDDCWTKLNTSEANAHLQTHHPDYLFLSKYHAIILHGVPKTDIDEHLQPAARASELLIPQRVDDVEARAVSFIRLLETHGIAVENVGITGSVLAGLHTPASDIDFVIYGRNYFYKAREAVRVCIEQGLLGALDKLRWKQAYERRCCSLSLKEFIFHEKRKYNKFLVNNTKVDISLILLPEEIIPENGPFTKRNSITLRTRIQDDRFIFDYPCRYGLEHDEFREAVSYTNTYMGQAYKGEYVEISGVVEIDTNGNKRVIVGTSREATGEYIKLLTSSHTAS